MDTTTIMSRATLTSRRALVYRWVGAVGSGRVNRAQDYPGAAPHGYFSAEQWSSSGTVAQTREIVTIPIGLLVIDSERTPAGHAYTAGLTAAGREHIDWAAARHVRYVDRVIDGYDVRVHVVEVGGVHGEYAESE